MSTLLKHVGFWHWIRIPLRAQGSLYNRDKPGLTSATIGPRKAALSLIAVALLLASLAWDVQGQSTVDGFDPNANGGADVFLVQPDGKILIGGGFTSILGVSRNGMARINSDGTLDLDFNPNVNNAVLSIALQSDGKILVGGQFGSVAGQPRIAIARLDPITGTPDSFNPNSDGSIFTVAVQNDGKILACGNFKNLGGQARNYIARLDPTTGLADSFNPNAAAGFGQYIRTVAVQRDGKILVGGAFSSIGGQTRNRMARLDPVTGLADSFNPNPSSVVTAIVVQADGKILVGGNFSSIGGQSRGGIARLDPVTGLADSFHPGSDGPVLDIKVQPDGKILVGGGFYTIGGQPQRLLIARLDPVTGLADSFDPNANMAVCCQAPNVYGLAVQPDGKVLVAGSFIGMAPNGGPQITRNHVARMEKDGFADQTLDLNAIGSKIVTTALQPDGKMLIGGSFSSVLGVARNNIARLNTNGSLDTSFNPNVNSDVLSIAVQADGRIVVGGNFASVGGQSRNYMARLDAATGAADSFTPNANGSVEAIAVQMDGKIVAGGNFTTIGAQNRNRMARLDAMSGLADSFNPNANGAVRSIAVQADGKILTSGAFTNIGGAQRNYLARLDGANGAADSFDPNANGAVTVIAVQMDGKIVAGGAFTNIGGAKRNYLARLDGVNGFADSFDPNSNGAVNSVALQADGKIVVGGAFTSIGGQTRNYIARLDGMSGPADVFDANAKNVVHSIALPADGKILAGGEFTNVGGQPRKLFARLSNDIPAKQDLNATPSAITWSRSGASVQFTRVIFEFSTDNFNYTSLGNGTASGSDWTLTGLSLPNAQSFYIRARGFYRTGQNNGSESIAESVRQVFLHEVTVANVVSRKMHGAAGTFDINLPRTGNPGIECRSGGASGDYQLVFSFSNPLTSVGNASLTSRTGSISSRMIDTDAHNYLVNLTGVSNAQLINVTLTNVNDSAGNSSSSVAVPMGVLMGDVDGNGTVNSSDVSQTKANSGQLIDTANFRSDASANGAINASDVALVKSKSGTGLHVAARTLRPAPRGAR